MGVKEIYIEDLREDFARDYVFPMFRANAIYEGEYLLGTSIARPLIAKRLVEIANRIRSLEQLALLESVSTRLLIAAGRLMVRDVPPRLAAVTAIAEPLSDDPDAVTAMRQIIELTL